MRSSVLILAIVPTLASAGWHLQLYRDQHYKNVIEDRSGLVGQPCKTLSVKDDVESMHWEHGTMNACNVRLFDNDGCKGAVIADAKWNDWNLPAFSDVNENRVNSYKIDC